MLLPLSMLRNLQMPILRKLSLAVLFGLGVLVIITATIRVVQIGQIKGVRPSLVWLATWSTIESSVGCGPGLYRKARDIRKAHKVHENQEFSKITIGGNSNWSGRNRLHLATDVPLATYSVASTSGTRNGNAGDSEEDLVTRKPVEIFTMTKTVLVN
ncbi:hypothetical protein PG988_005910 [Apiospora saccharicola]